MSLGLLYLQREAQKLFQEMEQAYNESKLPESPDVEKVDKLVQEILYDHFGDIFLLGSVLEKRES
jgi:hypothetical protein